MADRRRLRGFALGVLATVAVVIASSSVVLAAQGLIANDGTVNDSSARAKPATSTIEKGSVALSVQGQLTSKPKGTWTVPDLMTSTSPHLVTRDGLPTGAPVSEGSVLATISERPVIALSGSLPYYRPLSVGAAGDDVLALQQSLLRLGYGIRADKAGTLGIGTALGIVSLYSDRHFTAMAVDGGEASKSNPAQVTVPLGELYMLPGTPVMTKTSCGAVGELIKDSICSLVSTESVAQIAFAQSDAGTLKTGDPVALHLESGEEVAGTLGALTTPNNASAGPTDGADASTPAPSDGSGEASGGDGSAEVTFDVATETPLPAGAAGTGIVIVKSSSADSLRVVEIAIRSDSQEHTWMTDSRGKKLSVKVGVCADGYCEVSGESIAVGTTVALPISLSDGSAGEKASR